MGSIYNSFEINSAGTCLLVCGILSFLLAQQYIRKEGGYRNKRVNAHNDGHSQVNSFEKIMLNEHVRLNKVMELSPIVRLNSRRFQPDGISKGDME